MQGRRFRFGEYEADLGLQELRKRGTRIGLQHKPFHVLELLLRRPGQLVTRQELFDYLWPDSHVSYERGLNSAVNSLRQVLGESSKECHYIETRPGLGYRFIAEVREVSGEVHCEAFEDCLKGRYLLDRMTEDETHKALAYFQSASGDESYGALAHCGIADAYCQLVLMGSVPGSRVCERARASAEWALRRDPEMAQAHVAHARVKMLFDWDWPGARSAILRSIELDGRSVAAYTLLASLECTLGEWESARNKGSQAIAIDPLSFPANLQLAACLLAARDFQGAVNQCWKMLNLSPSFAPAQLLLALAYEQMGMYEEAVVEFQNAQLCPGCRVQAISGLSAALSRAGLEAEAEQAFAELCELGRARSISGYWYALAHAARQQKEQALACLEAAWQQKDAALLGIRAEARLDGLRDSGRFQVLLP